MSETYTVTLTSNGSVPKRIDRIIAKYPKLSREQCGHLRHFHNIASKPDGDWSFLGSQEPGQEWDTAFRYQLATMAYATGATHYHHLPAMRSMLKTLFLKLIGKMMRREVWGYWFLTSHSGVRVDPDLKELRKPWADPVCKENIMYSGHILLMASLFTMLFDDHRFDGPEGLVFNWDPLFWGMGPEKFSYSRQSLQDVIIKQMEEENWMGVCCEPNMIFIICNQFPLIAMRYNDVTDGRSVLDFVLPKYKAAWAEKKGFIGENGLFRRWYWKGRKQLLESSDISHTAWAMAFMPWNFDFVKSIYPTIGQGFVQRAGDRINVNSPVVATKIREIISSTGADPNSDATVQEAKAATANQDRYNVKAKLYMSPTFGYVAQWISEVSGGDDLAAILRHADEFLHPKWDNGGLYYPRCDDTWDSDDNWLHVDPYTGNAAIGYARLNIKEGQKKMFDNPWTRDYVESSPWVDGFGLDDDVDCSRGVYDFEEQALVLTARTWNGISKTINGAIKNLPTGSYETYLDGVLQNTTNISSPADVVNISFRAGGIDTDIVVLRCRA